MLSRDDIIRMAREAGIKLPDGPFPARGSFTLPELLGLAALVAAAERTHMIAEGWRQCAQGQRTSQFCGMVEQARLEEREACAQVCDYQHDRARTPSGAARANACAAAIRARGTQPQTCPDCRGIGYDASGQTCGCQN